MLFAHDDTFLQGVFVLLNGYVMAILCVIVFALHVAKAHIDPTRRWSRFWKGATYLMLGIGFFISALDIMSVENVRRMLRLIVAILLWSEIAYHAPVVIEKIPFVRRFFKVDGGNEERLDWTQQRL